MSTGRSSATGMSDSRPSDTTREEAIDDFNEPWCQKLLNDPTYEYTEPKTRVSDRTNGNSFNSLMGKTLFTDDTLRAIRYLYSPNPVANTQAIGGELIALISLGGEMTSHNHVLHGGINTVLVDEVGGSLAMREAPEGISMMAVNFNVNLRKSVRTPGIIVSRAWRERPEEGRKWWVRCVIEQDGVRCIDAECLYLKINVEGAKL